MRTIMHIHRSHVAALALALAVVGGTAGAVEPRIVKTIRWSEQQAAGNLSAGKVVELPGQTPAEQLVVAHEAGAPADIQLLTLQNPGVGAPAYVLRGRVKYENVKGRSYLQLLNHFPDNRIFFTRSLSSFGPMKAIQGTSEWRAFELPFMITGPELRESDQRPTTLTLSLHLPDSGTVYLSDLQLEQLATMPNPAYVPGAWWGPQGAGIAGGVIGTLLGCTASLIAGLASVGRARTLAIGLLATCIAASGVLTVAGLVALVLGQPWLVVFPLLFSGIIGLAVLGQRWPQILRQYEQHELRKMAALDVA